MILQPELMQLAWPCSQHNVSMSKWQPTVSFFCSYLQTTTSIITRVRIIAAFPADEAENPPHKFKFKFKLRFLNLNLVSWIWFSRVWTSTWIWMSNWIWEGSLRTMIYEIWSWSYQVWYLNSEFEFEIRNWNQNWNLNLRSDADFSKQCTDQLASLFKFEVNVNGQQSPTASSKALYHVTSEWGQMWHFRSSKHHMPMSSWDLGNDYKHWKRKASVGTLTV